jgi:DNA-binding FadR family transcriptional regulator
MSSASPFTVVRQPRKRTSAVDAIVGNVRAMIESGELKVGDGLPPERDLAGQLGVSRNTVREAIKRLEAYGVVATKQKDGARIVNQSLDAMVQILSFRLDNDERTFRDVQRFRGLLETGVVADIIERVTDADLAELDAINRRLGVGSNILALAEVDLQFHVRFLSIARNDTILKVHDVLSGVILQLMTLGKATSGSALAMQDHAGIIDALARRDETLARTRITEHLKTGARYLATAKAAAR